MTENTPPENSQPVEPPAVAPAPVATLRLRDRVLGMRGVAAVALAGLIVGGGGGFALGAVTQGDDDRMGPGGGFGGPPGQFQQFPNGPQGGPGQGFPGGQMPPGTAPQEPTQPDSPAPTPGSGT
jgi:hypothetical protein